MTIETRKRTRENNDDVPVASQKKLNTGSPTSDDNEPLSPPVAPLSSASIDHSISPSASPSPASSSSSSSSSSSPLQLQSPHSIDNESDEDGTDDSMSNDESVPNIISVPQYDVTQVPTIMQAQLQCYNMLTQNATFHSECGGCAAFISAEYVEYIKAHKADALESLKKQKDALSSGNMLAIEDNPALCFEALADAVKDHLLTQNIISGSIRLASIRYLHHNLGQNITAHKDKTYVGDIIVVIHMKGPQYKMELVHGSNRKRVLCEWEVKHNDMYILTGANRSIYYHRSAGCQNDPDTGDYLFRDKLVLGFYTVENDNANVVMSPSADNDNISVQDATILIEAVQSDSFNINAAVVCHLPKLKQVITSSLNSRIEAVTYQVQFATSLHEMRKYFERLYSIIIINPTKEEDTPAANARQLVSHFAQKHFDLGRNRVWKYFTAMDNLYSLPDLTIQQLQQLITTCQISSLECVRDFLDTCVKLGKAEPVIQVFQRRAKQFGRVVNNEALKKQLKTLCDPPKTNVVEAQQVEGAAAASEVEGTIEIVLQDENGVVQDAEFSKFIENEIELTEVYLPPLEQQRASNCDTLYSLVQGVVGCISNHGSSSPFIFVTYPRTPSEIADCLKQRQSMFSSDKPRRGILIFLLQVKRNQYTALIVNYANKTVLFFDPCGNTLMQYDTECETRVRDTFRQNRNGWKYKVQLCNVFHDIEVDATHSAVYVAWFCDVYVSLNAELMIELLQSGTMEQIIPALENKFKVEDNVTTTVTLHAGKKLTSAQANGNMLFMTRWATLQRKQIIERVNEINNKPSMQQEPSFLLITEWKQEEPVKAVKEKQDTTQKKGQGKDGSKGTGKGKGKKKGTGKGKGKEKSAGRKAKVEKEEEEEEEEEEEDSEEEKPFSARQLAVHDAESHKDELQLKVVGEKFRSAELLKRCMLLHTLRTAKVVNESIELSATNNLQTLMKKYPDCIKDIKPIKDINELTVEHIFGEDPEHGVIVIDMNSEIEAADKRAKEALQELNQTINDGTVSTSDIIRNVFKVGSQEPIVDMPKMLLDNEKQNKTEFELTDNQKTIIRTYDTYHSDMDDVPIDRHACDFLNIITKYQAPVDVSATGHQVLNYVVNGGIMASHPGFDVSKSHSPGVMSFSGYELRKVPGIKRGNSKGKSFIGTIHTEALGGGSFNYMTEAQDDCLPSIWLSVYPEKENLKKFYTVCDNLNLSFKSGGVYLNSLEPFLRKGVQFRRALHLKHYAVITKYCVPHMVIVHGACKKIARNWFNEQMLARITSIRFGWKQPFVWEILSSFNRSWYKPLAEEPVTYVLEVMYSALAIRASCDVLRGTDDKTVSLMHEFIHNMSKLMLYEPKEAVYDQDNVEIELLPQDIVQLAPYFDMFNAVQNYYCIWYNSVFRDGNNNNCTLHPHYEALLAKEATRFSDAEFKITDWKLGRDAGGYICKSCLIKKSEEVHIQNDGCCSEICKDWFTAQQAKVQKLLENMPDQHAVRHSSVPILFLRDNLQFCEAADRPMHEIEAEGQGKQNLFIKQSAVQGAGDGLFIRQDAQAVKKYETLSFYHGHIVDCEKVSTNRLMRPSLKGVFATVPAVTDKGKELKNADPLFQISWAIDCTGFASFSNDGAEGPTGKLPQRLVNASTHQKATVNVAAYMMRYGFLPFGLLALRVSKQIAPGKEVHIEYGEAYWKYTKDGRRATVAGNDEQNENENEEGEDDEDTEFFAFSQSQPNLSQHSNFSQ